MSELAYKIEGAYAVYYDGSVIIRAKIDVTATNQLAYLERSPILIFPPSHEYFALERQTAPFGGQVILPQSVTQSFPTPGGNPGRITIQAKSNRIDVDVQDVGRTLPSTSAGLARFKRDSETTTIVADNGGGGVPTAAEAGTIFDDTSTGYSDHFKFEEALSNAIAKLPPMNSSTDVLSTVRVTGIGAEVGGFVGFTRLWVSISRVYIKP